MMHKVGVGVACVWNMEIQCLSLLGGVAAVCWDYLGQFLPDERRGQYLPLSNWALQGFPMC